MAGFDDQPANRPGFVVYYKITHVANGSIARLNVVAVHGLYAPQMRIDSFVVTLSCICFLIPERTGRRRHSWKIAHAPHCIPLPVGRPAVILVILFFVLSGHRLVRLNRRTVFDLLASQIHEQDFSVLMEAAESMGSEEHHAPRYQELVSTTTYRAAQFLSSK
jgi:hypothetical protein